MQNKNYTFYLLPIFICCFSVSVNASFLKVKQQQDTTKKVVFILIDGIAADMLLKAKTPNLDAIAKVGGYSNAYVGGQKKGYSETPTISAVGYNSMLTGTWANKHNVWDNDIENPNYNYPSIFQLFKESYPNKKTAIFSTWLDNRTKLIGDNLPETNHLKMDYAFDGFELDTIDFPHDEDRLYIKNIDAKVANEAAKYIKTEGPDLSWVYLEFPDDMGHKFGDSPQLYDAITFEDKLIGEIWKSVLYREKEFNEEWLVLLTTDHGRTLDTGKDHGGQTDRERSTWVVTNAKNTNGYFKNETPAIVDIMPTIQRFLNIHINDVTTFEIDGISLIGAVDVLRLRAKIDDNNTLKITWDNPDNTSGKATVFVSATNKFKAGGIDEYMCFDDISLLSETFIISNLPTSNFYKVVFKTANTTLNTWVIKTP